MISLVSLYIYRCPPLYLVLILHTKWTSPNLSMFFLSCSSSASLSQPYQDQLPELHRKAVAVTVVVATFLVAGIMDILVTYHQHIVESLAVVGQEDGVVDMVVLVVALAVVGWWGLLWHAKLRGLVMAKNWGAHLSASLHGVVPVRAMVVEAVEVDVAWTARRSVLLLVQLSKCWTPLSSMQHYHWWYKTQYECMIYEYQVMLSVSVIYMLGVWVLLNMNFTTIKFLIFCLLLCLIYPFFCFLNFLIRAFWVSLWIMSPIHAYLLTFVNSLPNQSTALLDYTFRETQF